MLYVLLVGMSRVDYKNMARIYLEVCTLKAFPIPYINQNNPRSFISNAQLHGIFFLSDAPMQQFALFEERSQWPVDGRYHQ